MSFLDTVVILSRSTAQLGIYPPIDLSASSSAASSRAILGTEHYQTLIKFQSFLEDYKKLQAIVSIVGESELSAQDRLTYTRTKKVINYLTQPFFVTEGLTGRKGVYVSRAEVVADIQIILSGKLDQVPTEKLLYIGTLKEAKLV